MSMLIEEADVTAVNLAVELERAVIQHVLQEDQSIYVTEDGMFPFWIKLNQEIALVSLRTHTDFRSSVSAMQRLEICNELNMNNYLITAYTQNDRLYMEYVLNYRDGLLRETFIRCCRQFANSVEKGLAQVDCDNEFVLAPGQTELGDE